MRKKEKKNIENSKTEYDVKENLRKLGSNETKSFYSTHELNNSKIFYNSNKFKSISNSIENNKKPTTASITQHEFETYNKFNERLDTHNTNINNRIDIILNDFSKIHDKIDKTRDNLDSKIEQHVTKQWFFWIIGGLTLGFISSLVYLFALSFKNNETNIHINHSIDSINKNIESLNVKVDTNSNKKK